VKSSKTLPPWDRADVLFFRHWVKALVLFSLLSLPLIFWLQPTKKPTELKLLAQLQPGQPKPVPIHYLTVQRGPYVAQGPILKGLYQEWPTWRPPLFILAFFSFFLASGLPLMRALERQLLTLEGPPLCLEIAQLQQVAQSLQDRQLQLEQLQAQLEYERQQAQLQLHTLSHDLRTPLTALLLQQPDLAPALVLKERLQQLLDQARLDLDVPPQISEIHLHDLLEELFPQCQVELAERTPILRADPFLLRQILSQAQPTHIKTQPRQLELLTTQPLPERHRELLAQCQIQSHQHPQGWTLTW
jgi:signal transduction histidine kinase